MATRKPTTAEIAMSPWDQGVSSGAALLGATRRSPLDAGDRAIAGARAGAGLTTVRVGTDTFDFDRPRARKTKRGHRKAHKGKKTAPVKASIRKHLSAIRKSIAKLHP